MYKNPSVTAFFQILRNNGAKQVNRLLARTCIGCRAESELVVCSACYTKLKKPNFQCVFCGIALPVETQQLKCINCIVNAPTFDSLDYLANYEGALANWIVSAKLGRQAIAIEAIRELIQRRFSEIDRKFYQGYTLLPTPIPKYRLMHRGFNLPLLMAKSIAQDHELPILPSHVVLMPRFIKKQTLLSKKQRENRYVEILINEKLPKKILIIDDVVTTCKTVGNLSMKLRNNGVEALSVWALGRGQWYFD